MGFFIAGSVLTSLGLLGVVIGAVALALPVAWLWMLVDALLREEWEYPGATASSNNKLVWVLLILFVHVSAVAYFALVFRARARGSAPGAAAQAAA